MTAVVVPTRDGAEERQEAQRNLLEEPATEPLLFDGDARVIAALDAMVTTLESAARDQLLLSQRLSHMREARTSGMTWHDVIAKEEQPSTMQLLSQTLGSRSRSSGALRKELVESLRDEQTSIPEIARMFGVTHQRVSNLARRRARTA